jgi:hypothetical protein
MITRVSRDRAVRQARDLVTLSDLGWSDATAPDPSVCADQVLGVGVRVCPSLASGLARSADEAGWVQAVV